MKDDHLANGQTDMAAATDLRLADLDYDYRHYILYRLGNFALGPNTGRLMERWAEQLLTGQEP